MPNSPTLIYDNVEAEGCFSVVIVDDPLIEGNETFQYKIESVPHENFTIAVGQPSVVTVTILDNDFPGNQVLIACVSIHTVYKEWQYVMFQCRGTVANTY